MLNTDICLVQFPIFEGVSMITHAPAILSAIVHQQRFSYKFLDWNVEYNVYKSKTDDELIEKWVNEIKIINPRFLGISIFAVLYPKKIPMLIKLFQKIKTIKGLKIIIGGHWVTLSKQPKEFLELGLIDYYVKGDGEEAIIALLNGEDHESINNNIPYNNTNLDSLPLPIYDNFNKLTKRFYTVPDLVIESSRGCINNCSFCPNLYTKIILRNPKIVAREMYELSIKYNASKFVFSDALLNISSNRIHNLTDEIIKLKKVITDREIIWKANWAIRSKEMFNEEIYQKLEKAGCRRLSIGLESGSERIRKEFNKSFINNDDIFFLVDQTKKYNINLTMSIIIGFHKETEEDHNKTLKLLKLIKDRNKDINVDIFIYKEDINYTESTLKSNHPIQWNHNSSDYIMRMKRMLKTHKFIIENDIYCLPLTGNMLIDLLYEYKNHPEVPKLIKEYKQTIDILNLKIRELNLKI